MRVKKIKLYRRGRLMREIDDFIIVIRINFIKEETRLELLPPFDRQTSVTSIIRSISDDITEKLRSVKRTINQPGAFLLKRTNIMWRNTKFAVNNIYARVGDITSSLSKEECLSEAEQVAVSEVAEYALLEVLEDSVPHLLDNLGWIETPSRGKLLPVFAPMNVPGRGKFIVTPTNQPTTKPGGLGG